MHICDICGRQLKAGEDILRFKNKTYCPNCANKPEVQKEVEKFKTKITEKPRTSLIIGIIICLALIIGGIIY